MQLSKTPGSPRSTSPRRKVCRAAVQMFNTTVRLHEQDRASWLVGTVGRNDISYFSDIASDQGPAACARSRCLLPNPHSMLPRADKPDFARVEKAAPRPVMSKSERFAPLSSFMEKEDHQVHSANLTVFSPGPKASLV